jgi:hypothetical protein
MADSSRLPIVRSAIAAWGDGFNALSQMRILTGAALVALLPITYLRLPLLKTAYTTTVLPGLGFHLLSLAVSIAYAFLVTPLAIAVHRFVLLGELTERYQLRPADRRFLRFFACLLALYLLISTPVLHERASQELACPAIGLLVENDLFRELVSALGSSPRAGFFEIVL